MGPNNTPEQPQQKNMQEQARAEAEQIIESMRASYQSELAEILKIKDDGERIRAKAALEQKSAEKFRLKLNEQVRDVADSGRTDSPEDKKIMAEKAKHIFLEAKVLGDEGVKVGDAKSQQFVNKIVEYIKNGQISDEGALVLERNIGKDLLDGIVFSKSGEPPSDFEKHLRIAYGANPQATEPLLRNLAENQDVFGYEGTPKDLLDKIGKSIPESNQQENLTPEQQQQQQLMEAMGQRGDKRFGPDGGYYETRFTDTQKDLIATFYDPEKFVNYMERLSNGYDEPGFEKVFLKTKNVEAKKLEIQNNIKKYYEKNNKTLTDNELKTKTEEIWGEEVSKQMEWNISDVINQLFLELQQKSPNKFYEQIMQEDIFQGPGMIQKRIQAAINALMTEVSQIEGGNNPLAERMKKLKPYLYQQDVPDVYIEERGKKDEINKKIYPRLHPLAHGENIGVTDFIRHLYQTIDQTISKAEYFHNSRAIYGHPPGEKGFYQQLGDFAEQMKGGGIDEIMMLPDGSYIMEAYQLYEKMLQEDFAQMDHRHRPDQLSNKLERVNTQIELQVFKQLQEFYPDLTEERLRNIVNSGVGISRGIFLTESEASAYADPVDSSGGGMVASYSTNDAGSLNVFNPMHTILRWQGEHNFSSMYFMPVGGKPGMWDHNEAWRNMAKYMDSFIVGKGRGKGKDGLPEEVFADSLMDIGKVGGPGKRKGWRMRHTLEGHFVYDDDGSINAPKTFKAMEAIGYEAIYNFYTTKQAGSDLLKATEKTDPKNVKERKELFEYIYSRYFHEGGESTFQKSEFDDYWSKLLIKGEEKALKVVKGEVKDRKSEKGSLLAGSWEEQIVFETSQMFMENMLAHYVAARMPTKFLRMDKNRLHEKGIGHWEKIWREFKAKGWKREDFDKTMKDLTMAEMLLGRQKSEVIRNNIRLDKNWKLHQINNDMPFRLDENKIRELLSKNRLDGKFKDQKEIENAIEVFNKIKESYKAENFLDSEGYKRIKDYTFTFGLEDTDISLMTFRGTGPRMVARAIKDVATIENVVTPWIINMPLLMNEIAINGKHDFSPIIEYMRKAQKAITDVNGVADTYEHMYKIAGTVINYFKKDAMAKPLLGLFRLGKKNSIAAEMAGRSSAVWEWDSREISQFCIAMESFGLLKNNPYNLQAKGNDGKFSGGVWEDRYIINPFTKKLMKWGKQRHVDYEYNTLRLRKEHGGDTKAIMYDMFNQFIPLAIVFLLWKFFKDALDETEGKKK